MAALIKKAHPVHIQLPVAFIFKCVRTKNKPVQNRRTQVRARHERCIFKSSRIILRDYI